ncbi:MAG: transcriptional regulator [Rhizobium sp.]|nr:transcriptional regulator [Rhizobium sp.]MBW8321001.1 transcriptional regulator [Rhizobium sp.]MBW8445648.1 hypothetical protein [Arenimonas sp.]
MGKSSIQITLSDDLQEHVRRQVAKGGPYRDADDYIRSLVSRDRQAQSTASAWIGQHLADAMQADEETYLLVSAEDVIKRNKKA